MRLAYEDLAFCRYDVMHDGINDMIIYINDTCVNVDNYVDLVDFLKNKSDFMTQKLTKDFSPESCRLKGFHHEGIVS